MRLTQKYIDRVQSPKRGQAFLRDEGLPGFGLKITARGTKTWFIEKQIHGRGRRVTIGRAGALTLDEARKAAQKQFVAIAEGHDPSAERLRRRQAATWGELETMYLARHASRKKSAIDDIGLLNNHLPHWRPRPLTSLTRQDMIELHTRIGLKPSTVIRPGHPTALPAPRLANKMISLVRSMFNLATDWGLFAGPNPCVRIRRFPERSRDRFVTPAELPRLWTALAADPSPFIRVAFLVSILTGARRSEVLQMKWSDVDFAAGTWRIAHTKANRVHLLPLPKPVIQELQTLPRMEGNEFIFCGRWGRNHLVNVTKPWSRIRKAAGLTDVRVHDLRRTLGSWLVAQGASLPLIGKALNHSSVSTTQVYARLQLDPVRLALEANAQKMLNADDTPPL